MPTPDGRPATVVVTGGNAGLGRHAARAVLSDDPGWHVVLACRDVERAGTARRELAAGADRAGGAPERVGVVRLDLASLASVRAFPAALAARHLPPLRALVANAGVQVLDVDHRTADGFELTFGVNHLGHYLLTRLLLDQLAAPARIVLVASGTHHTSFRKKGGFPDPVWSDADTLAHPPLDPGRAGPRAGRVAYATSKLATVYTAYELARRLGPARGITCVAYDPGLMPGTGLGRDYPSAQRFVWRRLMPALRVLPGVTGAPAAGRRLARLVTDPRLAHLDGAYVELGRVTRSSEESYDRARAAALWEESARLVGLEARI